ncbi:uncharacterized protein LOC131241476 isoform X2 [Magnolia sinica]|uniref:uncharacterized protein LOC131241476 isoform X2 n=1 Tax=Magnolia sinica TaxID=86752 RepID=UPI002657D2C5|nr:uncharacterized protein LOC131241476 isoform X2 [Magnolia sinica]
MSMLQSLNNVSLASSILVSTLASPFTLAMHLLNLPKLYNLFAGWFFRSWQTHKNTQIINTQSILQVLKNCLTFKWEQKIRILMSTFDMKDESKEVIWQGEIGGVYAALDTFKAEKAFPMCKLTRLLRDSLGGRTKTCIIDVGSGRNANTGKDNGVNQSTDRGLTSTSSPVSQDIENKATIPTMR